MVGSAYLRFSALLLSLDPSRGSGRSVVPHPSLRPTRRTLAFSPRRSLGDLAGEGSASCALPSGHQGCPGPDILGPITATPWGGVVRFLVLVPRLWSELGGRPTTLATSRPGARPVVQRHALRRWFRRCRPVVARRWWCRRRRRVRSDHHAALRPFWSWDPQRRS